MIDTKTLNAMYAHAKHSASAKGIDNMIQLAKSELAISPDELDRDPWLFNVQNGTIDLRSGEIREHRREDFITKLAPVAFDPDADCPRWKALLNVVFAGNEELIGYLQRLIGYCLTGVTREHVLPFLYGMGANGKSTLCETILKLLGPDYSMKASPDLLMAKRGESHPTERADLHGKRFVACIETEDGRRLAEALVKELTGGDRIRARRMREDFWEFVPTHHTWLAGNHKPAVYGGDHGIWRRIKLIPFEVVIPAAEQDKELPDKLALELPGILNWAIAGCLDWQRDGLREPAAVQAHTHDYEAEMDDVGRFIDEHCETGDGFQAPATALYEAFLEAVPDCRINQKTFGSRLTLKGFARERITGGVNKGKSSWRGLRLLTDADKELREQLGQLFSQAVNGEP